MSDDKQPSDKAGAEQPKTSSLKEKPAAHDGPNTPSHGPNGVSGDNNAPSEKLPEPTLKPDKTPLAISWNNIVEGDSTLDDRFRGTTLEGSLKDTTKPSLEAAAGYLKRAEGIVDIGIYGLDGKIIFRRAVIDMGSRVNVMADNVRCSLGIGMGKYTGPAIQVASGKKVEPMGLVEAVWHFAKHTQDYRTLFLVINTRNFDTLLGEQFTTHHQICKRNRGILW